MPTSSPSPTVRQALRVTAAAAVLLPLPLVSGCVFLQVPSFACLAGDRSVCALLGVAPGGTAAPVAAEAGHGAHAGGPPALALRGRLTRRGRLAAGSGGEVIVTGARYAGTVAALRGAPAGLTRGAWRGVGEARLTPGSGKGTARTVAMLSFRGPGSGRLCVSITQRLSVTPSGARGLDGAVRPLAATGRARALARNARFRGLPSGGGAWTMTATGSAPAAVPARLTAACRAVLK